MNESPKSPEIANLLIAGIAGIVVGAVVARALVSDVPERDTASSEPVAVQALSDHSKQTPKYLERREALGTSPTQPRRAVEDELEQGKPLPDATTGEISAKLRTAIHARRWLRKLRTEFHQRIGEGTLISEGKLTQTGQALLIWFRSLEELAIEPKPYDVEGFEAVLAAGEMPTEEMEARYGRMVTRLLLDSRFLKRVAPFRSPTHITRLMKKKGVRSRVLNMLVALVQATDDEQRQKILYAKHPNFRPMLAILKRYREMAKEAKCKKLPSRNILAKSPSKYIKLVQERLSCEGYYDGPIDGQWNEGTKKGVSDYELTHDLEPKGYVTPKTVKSMNVPLAHRVAKIALAVQRFRESRVEDFEENAFLYVNLPLFRLRMFENGKMLREHRVIVGTNRLDDNKITLRQGHLNRTKLFGTDLYQIIINPDWILPERISKGELGKKLKENPNYLQEQRIKKVTLKDGTEILVQRRGRKNPLGKVKFMLKRSNAIYIHDTDKRWLFREHRRDFSHGCIRLDKAMDFAEWLLLRDGNPKAKVERWMNLLSTQEGIYLKNKLQMVTEYVTVDILSDGKPIFLSDIYGYDRAAKRGKYPPRETVRWGADILRPRWVPFTPIETVNEWRAAGKPAPADLRP